MTLKMFDFIDEVIQELEEKSEMLNNLSTSLSTDVELMFNQKLEGYVGVKSRVKSPGSLKEKILRNSYYKKYDDPYKLLINLSDLIGVRIECKFNEDENKIYRTLVKIFKNKNEDGLSYSEEYENILLDLNSKQPEKQKNGFRIYRIDGYYIYDGQKFPFELQIKSLVNLFWSEIEHRIVYKNYNYVLQDKFLKDIMASIKKNLLLMDNQLLLVYNHINGKGKKRDRNELEAILSKIIYEVYADKVNNSLGFPIDFRKSCDYVVKYLLLSSENNNEVNYSNVFIDTLERIGEIRENKVPFDRELKFERELKFKDNFSREIADTILESVNNDFQWTLFFRIIFEIERGTNSEDFEKFISFIKTEWFNIVEFKSVEEKLGTEAMERIREDIMLVIAESFKVIKSVEFIHMDNIDQITSKVKNIISFVVDKVETLEDWKFDGKSVLAKFKLSLYEQFNVDIVFDEVIEMVASIRDESLDLTVLKNMVEYYGIKDIGAKEIVKIINEKK